MKDELKRQAVDAAETPAGELPASIRFRGLDHQSKILKSECGFVAERKSMNEDEPRYELISDFVMDLVRVERFADRDVRTVQRIVRLHNRKTGQLVDVVAQPKDMVGKYNFRTWLLSHGDFNFWGTEADVERIIAMTFNGTSDEVRLKNISGYDTETGHWIFTNGAVSKDGKVTLLDEKKGYIPVGDEKYRLTTNDRDEKVKRTPTLKFGVLADKSRALLKTVIRKTVELWGPGAEIGWAWFLAILWRSNWIAHTEQFPLLFVTGNPSIGKTQFIKACGLQLYGISMEPLSIAKLTPVGLFNITNSMCNIPLFLDEFKSEMLANPEIMEMLKGNADNASKVVGSTDPHKTVTRTHRTGFVICGESRPTDEALASRNVSADLVKNDNRKLFDETVELCQGLSCALVPFVQQWEEWWPHILDRSRALMTEWREATKLDSRIVFNYAKVCATIDVLLPDETRKARFFAAMVVKGEEMEDKNPLANLLKVLPYLLREKKAFIPCRVNLKKRILAVNANFLIHRCSEYYRSPIQNTKDLIRSGKMADLLIPSHTDTPVHAEVDDLRDGKVRKINSRCFVFDMTHPLVKEVAEFLAQQDKPDRDGHAYPTGPSNPDDPFMQN